MLSGADAARSKLVNLHDSGVTAPFAQLSGCYFPKRVTLSDRVSIIGLSSSSE